MDPASRRDGYRDFPGARNFYLTSDGHIFLKKHIPFDFKGGTVDKAGRPLNPLVKVIYMTEIFTIKSNFWGRDFSFRIQNKSIVFG